MKPSAFPAAEIWVKACTRPPRALKLPAAHTVTSKSPAICWPLRATAASATAWRRFCTTPSSAPGHCRRTEPASTIRTTTCRPPRCTTPTNGRAARERVGKDSADHGSLRQQFLLPRRGRYLCEPLRALSFEVATARSESLPDATHRVSARRAHYARRSKNRPQSAAEAV